MMEAIVLAGGLGTRLRRIVTDLPKPMAPIMGRPFLELLLGSLADKGFQHIVLSLGYMADKIIDYFGDRFEGMEITYEIEHKPLGTGGAARLAMSRCKTDHVFILNGDTFIDLETTEIENHWEKHKNPIIVACHVENTARYGRLETDMEKVLRFSGKGIKKPGFINAGSYILTHEMLSHIPVGEAFSMEEDFLPVAVEKRRFDVFVTRSQFIDIGVPEDYARAQTELVKIFRKS